VLYFPETSDEMESRGSSYCQYPLVLNKGDFMSENVEKETLNKEQLENANTELFNGFNPEEELWVVGGSGTASGSVTYQNGRPDGGGDVDYTW
jgi:hypothetical protein